MSTQRMFNALLFVQWRHQRVELALLAICCAILAPLAIWSTNVGSAEGAAYALLSAADMLGGIGGVIAAGTGALLAVRPFWLDARFNHTYALSLPIPRARYATLRVGAGLMLGLIPALGFLIGAVVAVQAAPTTPLNAYPVGLTIRFIFATMTAFAIAFAVQYGLGRRALRWLVIVAATIGGVELFGQIAFQLSFTSPFFELLANQYSPLAVFWNRWMLFDV